MEVAVAVAAAAVAAAAVIVFLVERNLEESHLRHVCNCEVVIYISYKIFLTFRENRSFGSKV
jgi:hypothetical protein